MFQVTDWLLRFAAVCKVDVFSTRLHDRVTAMFQIISYFKNKSFIMSIHIYTPPHQSSGMNINLMWELELQHTAACGGGSVLVCLLHPLTATADSLGRTGCHPGIYVLCIDLLTIHFGWCNTIWWPHLDKAFCCWRKAAGMCFKAWAGGTLVCVMISFSG